MPLQNRIDPFGDIFATPARGLWMGNRGCLHDDQKRIVREWKTKYWLICTLTSGDTRRTLMKPGWYTELFFMDEPTALAAGHRPCPQCRGQAYRSFKSAFATAAAAAGRQINSASDIDAVLHIERLGNSRPQVEASTLPDGAMVKVDGKAWAKKGSRLFKWTPDGYKSTRPTGSIRAELLTPASTVAALHAGYEVSFHPSVGEFD
jgi:hypothetical protein